MATLACIAFSLGVFLTTYTRAAAQTYLLSEGFEGPGYENSGWIVPPNSTSAPEPDHTGTVLLGNQSLRCNGVSFIQRPFEREDPFFCYLRVRWAAWSDYKFVVDWLDNTQGSTATLLTSFGNKLEIKHGSVSVPGTTTIALNTTYHVWIEWTKGSGSDGTMKLFVSTDGTKPTVPEVSITTGNGVASAAFDVGPFGAGVDVVYDSILIDDEPIGSNPGGNAPPSISGIANQSTPENTSTAPIAFTVGDPETNAVDLTVTGSSSNQDVIPNANIVFGGSESNRTVTLTPAPNQSGVATITVTVSDGTASSSTSFPITVGTFNSPPSISSIANQSTVQNTSTPAIGFVVDDAQTNADSLDLDGNSSNTTLVPTSNIAFGGAGTNRTVTITPAPGETGTATFTVFVNDGQLTNSTSFILTVSTVNTPPTITAISGQTIAQDSVLGPIGFTVGDAETAASAIVLTKASSNPDLIPPANIILGGSAENRTVTITPASGQSGTSTITLMVNDGELTVSRNFLVTVIPNGTGTPGGLLFEEGFEGPGYENSGWTELGLPDPNYTNQILRGSESLNLTGSEFIYRTFVATNNFDLYMRAHWNAWVDYISFIYFETADFQAAGSLFADNNLLQINHGSASVIGSTAIQLDTTYHIWLEWLRGDGTNGTLNLYVSTNVIKPTLPEASISTGNGGAIERIYFGSFSAGFDVVIDSLFIDDQPIGSNPEGNLPPSISSIADQTVDEDASTTTIPFSIGDLESSAASLTLAGFSSDTNLVPRANIVFGGSESNRTVVVTPAPNQFGTTTITIQVRDNALTTNTTFLLTVDPLNDAPQISLPGSPVNFVEGSIPVVLNSNATVIDIDSASFGGGQLTISISENSVPEDRLSIRNQGVGPGEIEVSGIGIAYEGVGIGTFSGGTNGSTPLVISFNASATPQAAQALLRNITFESVSAMPSPLPRTISVVAADGPSGTSAPATMVVNVTGVAANPTVTWLSPTPIIYGTPLSELQLTATADVSGTFSYLPPGGTVLSVGTEQPLSVIFTPTDSVNFNSITTSVPLTVTPAPLLVTANATNRVYGSANPAFTATISGFVNGDDEADLDTPVTFSTTADTTSPVGSYDIIPAGATDLNYSLSFTNALLSVTPAALLVTANATNRAYGNTNPIFTATISGFVNGDDDTDLLGALAFATLAETNSPVGPYAVTPAGLSSTNYTITFADGTLTVTAFALLVTADNQSKLYGADLPALTGTILGVQNADDITATFSTVATAASDVGLYLITPVLNDPNNLLTNYTVTIVNGTLTNLPAPLLVTANNTNRAYGDTNPIFTATISGFVNGDDETDLLGALTVTTLAETNSPVGPYAVTPAGLSSTNYTITFADGTLTVTAFAVLVTADNQSKLYGADLPALTGTILGVQNADDITATFSTVATTASDVGLYLITPVLNDPNNLLTNYTVTIVNGALTNLPAPLLVAATATNRVYGIANPAFTATFSGFVNGDDEADLDTPVTFSTTADATSPVGSYDIVPAGATDLNYSLSFTNAPLAVTPAGPLTLTLVSADAAGNVTLRVTSDPGQRVKIQAATDLATWDDLATLNNITGTIDYTDPAAPDRPKRFYRVVLSPGSPE
ncbi:MAG: hypothetical protein IPK15_10095 [Verrucomicrobia bacterium]|nr:hypothetical protein [Verrucomicrobiota bacterium]